MSDKISIKNLDEKTFPSLLDKHTWLKFGVWLTGVPNFEGFNVTPMDKSCRYKIYTKHANYPKFGNSDKFGFTSVCESEVTVAYKDRWDLIWKLLDKRCSFNIYTKTYKNYEVNEGEWLVRILQNDEKRNIIVKFSR